MLRMVLGHRETTYQSCSRNFTEEVKMSFDEGIAWIPLWIVGTNNVMNKVRVWGQPDVLWGWLDVFMWERRARILWQATGHDGLWMIIWDLNFILETMENYWNILRALSKVTIDHTCLLQSSYWQHSGRYIEERLIRVQLKKTRQRLMKT